MRIPLISALAPLVFEAVQEHHPHPPDPPKTLSFTPRHAHSHALDKSAPLLFSDTPASIQIAAIRDADMTLRTRRTVIRRPKVRPPHMLSWAQSAHARAAGRNATVGGWGAPLPLEPGADSLRALDDSGWEDVEVEAPDITDRQTLITMAKMAANAYSQHDDYGWYPLEGHNNGTEFGWEPDADGLRGHIVRQARLEITLTPVRGRDQLDRRHRYQGYQCRCTGLWRPDGQERQVQRE